MRPALPFPIPKGTQAIAVDPLYAFLRDGGTFVEKYGRDDCEPVLRVENELQQAFASWRELLQTTLCRSLYNHDEFQIPGLEKLCTEDNPKDRECVLPAELFESSFEKTHNSILRTNDAAMKQRILEARYLILCGITGTSCVGKSVEALKAVAPNLQIVIVQSLVASRKAQELRQKEFFDQWSHPSAKNTLVVPDHHSLKIS